MAAAVQTVYVLPTGDIPVPLANGRKLLRAGAPPEGFLVAYDLWVRRRIRAGELAIVAPPAQRASPTPAPTPAPKTPAPAPAPVKE